MKPDPRSMTGIFFRDPGCGGKDIDYVAINRNFIVSTIYRLLAFMKSLR
jgi:hypothetical protein